jgi:hypothetical protein
MILAEIGISIEEYNVHNIYNAVDMSVFHGFENKISLKELQAKHGSPNRILNAKEVADVDGYDIWEYDFQKDKIDCYIKKNDSIVDYIYCEFTTPTNIYNLVKDKEIAAKIAGGKASINYLVDDFKTTIRILKQNESMNCALNIALDDNTDLISSGSLHDELEGINENTPIPMADFCEISSFNYRNKKITINCDVNELPNDTIMTRIKNDPYFGKQFCIISFGDKGVFSFLTPKILEEEADICLIFKGKLSGMTVKYKIKTKELLCSPTTARQRLRAMIDYDNMGLVHQVNFNSSKLKMSPRFIQNNTLYISITYLDPPIYTTDYLFKKLMNKSFLDNENPEQKIILLCAQSGIGLCYINTFSKNGIQTTYTAYYSNSELKSLRKLIK